MPISFDSALGIHDKALLVRTQRAELLASNIANADTPGYKARDIDFKTVLKDLQAGNGTEMRTTNKRHINPDSGVGMFETKYRIPNQASLDGNTVDAQLEKSAFADNAMRYQASLSFLDSKIKGIKAALKGE